MATRAVAVGLVASAAAAAVVHPPALRASPWRNVSGPGSYYANINTGLSGAAFQAQLTALISAGTRLTYTQLWTAFTVVDEIAADVCGAGLIDDIYSAKCWTAPAEQCGNYAKEGDCYNREHSWPKSWWGGAENAAYTDLFHLYPSDGYDNNRRGNVPLGYVDNKTAVYVTSDGSMLGTCLAAANGTSNGLPSTCWEPSDAHKGELARSYFYVSTCYGAGSNAFAFSCCDEEGVDGATIKPWLLDTLLEWHAAFPPSGVEQQRNDLIFSQFQGNRNPFIDYPQWVAKIWAPAAQQRWQQL